MKHAIVAVDIVIFTIEDNDLKVLLIKMKKKPFVGMWAVPGGLVEVNESLEFSAKKHLLNETGVDNVYLEQLYTFGEVDRDPLGRVVSTAYFALIPTAKVTLKTTEEYEGVQWFSIKDLPELAYDHLEIVQKAQRRLKAKLSYTNIVYSLLPTEFTLTDLQKTYEIILGEVMDKRNFRKKILSLNMIKKTDKQTIGGASRPAAFYKFIKRSPQIIEIL